MARTSFIAKLAADTNTTKTDVISFLKGENVLSDEFKDGDLITRKLKLSAFSRALESGSAHKIMKKLRIMADYSKKMHREVMRRKRWNSNQEPAPVSLYYKHIYVQDMWIPTQHNLLSHKGRELKDISRDPLSEVEKVRYHLSFDVTTTLFYLFKGFDKRPHGSAPNLLKHSINGALQRAGALTQHVSPDTCDDHTFLACPHLRIYYPGSKELKLLEDRFNDIDFEAFLVYVLNNGDSTGDRDSTAGDAVAKRAIFGFGQVQGANSPNSEEYGKHYLPFYFVQFTTGNRAMPDELQKKLGQILSASQELLDQGFSDIGAIMDDALRTWLMAMRMNNKLGYAGSKSRFEFVDVFVESMAGLNRHCDVKNDRRIGYDFGASFSKVLHYEGRLYRLNFVMTTRSDCGSTMNHIYNDM